jgi:hypothetical protein
MDLVAAPIGEMSLISRLSTQPVKIDKKTEKTIMKTAAFNTKSHSVKPESLKDFHLDRIRKVN